MYNEPKLRKPSNSARGGVPLSFEGIWVRPRGGNTVMAPTSTIVMDTFKTHLDHDVIATALVVVPASLGWIFFNHLGYGIVVGLSAYIAYDYGNVIATYRTIDIRPLVQIYERTRNAIRSRVAKNI